MAISPSTHVFRLIALALVLGATASPVFANLRSASDRTVEQYKALDPSLGRFFERSAGYAVFPTVRKGGAVFGGA